MPYSAQKKANGRSGSSPSAAAGRESSSRTSASARAARWTSVPSAAARSSVATGNSSSSRTGLCRQSSHRCGSIEPKQLGAVRPASSSGSCRRAEPAVRASPAAGSRARRRPARCRHCRSRRQVFPKVAYEQRQRLPSGRACVRRLDHERRRRAPVGGRAPVLGPVGGARPGPAVHQLRASTALGPAASSTSRSLLSSVHTARPGARYDLGCLYIGVNDVRAPDWDAQAFEHDLGPALGVPRRSL